MGDKENSWLEGIGVKVADVLGNAVQDVKAAGSSAAGDISTAAKAVINDAKKMAGIAHVVAPRPLSADELADAKAIFGTSIDYSKVLIDGGSVAAAGACRTVGNTVHMTDDNFVPGTSDTTTDGKRTLVHELTHVWQYQHTGWTYAPKALWAQGKAAVMDGDRNKAYDWKSLLGTPWEKWNPEAQAEAVEDYNKSLHNVNDGKGKKADYDNLSLLQKYIDKLLGK